MNIETGQFLRFQIPARSRVLWLSPAWAVLCGLIASSAFVWTGRDVLIAALAVVVADGAWATQWWGLVDTDWRQLFANWKGIAVERTEAPLAWRGSPADRSQHNLARLRVWWQAGGREQAGTPLISALAALALGVLLSTVISWQALALTLAAFAADADRPDSAAAWPADQLAARFRRDRLNVDVRARGLWRTDVVVGVVRLWSSRLPMLPCSIWHRVQRRRAAGYCHSSYWLLS